jgi:hypothetical protein
LNQTTQIKSRVYANGQWSALNEAVFTTPLRQNNIIISELHYHPLLQDSVDESEFEFIELQNAGTETQNLSLDRFVNGVNYVFPANTILRPNECLVLSSDEHYFTFRYGFSPFSVYSGKLDNGGERIALLDNSGDTLISFQYDDKRPWPEDADGKGYSLILQRTSIPPDYSNAASWRSSYQLHGSPGHVDAADVEDSHSSVTGEFILQQNYPNPFNSTTVISFVIERDCQVTLLVYDITGRQIACLAKKKPYAAGHYTFQWDAADLSSGIYLLSMLVGNVKRMIKLVHLK